MTSRARVCSPFRFVDVFSSQSASACPSSPCVVYHRHLAQYCLDRSPRSNSVQVIMSCYYLVRVMIFFPTSSNKVVFTDCVFYYLYDITHSLPYRKIFITYVRGLFTYANNLSGWSVLSNTAIFATINIDKVNYFQKEFFCSFFSVSREFRIRLHVKTPISNYC